MTEYSLHSQLKALYSVPGDRLEAKLDNYVVDILRGDLAIEVQTQNFSAIKSKLQKLTTKHKVRLVYPLPEKKWITHVDENGTVLRKRKSPREGRLTDVFRELLMIPGMIGNVNFSLEVIFVDEEEVRCADRKGSWGRRSFSVKERRLLRASGGVIFREKTDYLKILPDSLVDGLFTNRELAKSSNIPLQAARQITYCLRKSGLLDVAGKERNAFIFRKSTAS